MTWWAWNAFADVLLASHGVAMGASWAVIATGASATRAVLAHGADSWLGGLNAAQVADRARLAVRETLTVQVLIECTVRAWRHGFSTETVCTLWAWYNLEVGGALFAIVAWWAILAVR